MKRLLAVNLSMTLIFALGLISCDKDKKLTGPTEPSRAGQATSQPVAKATTQATSGGICDRPQQVQDAILAKLGWGNCAQVDANVLARITGSLRVYDPESRLTEVPSGTFDGLTKLEQLYLDYNGLESLPADVFDDLDNLENLNLNYNGLAALPADVFDGLTKLERLELSENSLESLPADIFDGLSKLEVLYLSANELSALPADVFDDLDNLELLSLKYNDLDLDALPSDFFNAFPKLTWLSLSGIGKDLEGDGTGTMTTLSYDWYDSIPPTLEYLDLGSNELSALPADVFDDFTNLKGLWLSVNDLSALPADVFDGLSKLEELELNFNQLESLPADVFAGLASLKRLNLDINQLESLPAGLFAGLSKLEYVNLGRNPGTPFTFTAELEQQGDDAVVVKVAEGAPYDMAVTLSAEGGTLSSTDVTVAGGSLESGAINVTPNGQRSTQVTVSVESAAFKKKIGSDEGVLAGVGESLTLTFGALANSAATGAPTISGTAQVGQTLTADTADIEDADGWGHASFSYQWIANDGSTDTDIPGATGATYTLVAADAGKTVKVRVRFTDDAGNEETLTSAATSAVDHEEPVAAWSATLTVGVDASTIPATSGYSLWGDMGGTISTERFTLDGATYRVIFLMHHADGLYFGLDGKLATDFTLRIGDAEYTAQASSTPNSLVEEGYWWGVKDFNWTAGDQVEVSLTPVPGTGSALPDRPPAPLTAYFRFAPESHNGVDDFTFRTYFSEGISISSTTFRDHSFVVSGGSVIAAKGVNGSNRIWEITVAPNSSDDVTIALPADRACEEEGAICADDGRPLYNQPELTVPGREEVEQEEVSEEVIPEEEEEPLEADAATTESDDHVKKPASVRKPWATNITHNSARIEWKKASRAEEYVVLRRALYADNPESSLSPIATTSGLSYDDTDLVPQTEYIYRIVARNNVGEANRSPHVKFRTLSEP